MRFEYFFIPPCLFNASKAPPNNLPVINSLNLPTTIPTFNPVPTNFLQMYSSFLFLLMLFILRGYCFLFLFDNESGRESSPISIEIHPLFLRNSCTLAIVPSSFMTSQITPAGEAPASFAKSTAASVCPGLVKTPPSFAINGKI